MFLVLVNYVRPLEEIDRWLPDHVAFLDRYYQQKRFIFSGRRNPRVGGLILAAVQGREEMERIISEDPFYVNGLAEYEIVEFTPTKYDERFACFIPQP